jgi:CHAD domain-containing protein
MAYHLSRRRSVRRALERIVKNQLRAAAGKLEHAGSKTRDEAVHDARKRIKKIRAALLLVRKQLDAEYDKQDEQLGKAGHQLAIERDADAMVETFDQLRARYRSGLRGRKMATIRRKLASRAEDVKSHARRECFTEAAAHRLRKAAKRAGRWHLKLQGFKPVHREMKRAFKRARKGLRQVERRPTAERFHEWRKRIKDHWYHTSLVEQTRPSDMRVYAKRLHRLEAWLGQEHNLVLLRRHLASVERALASDREKATIDRDIERFQADLRRRALKLGRQIYNVKPRRFARNLRRSWRRWRHQS